jgi:hypothetical protein
MIDKEEIRQKHLFKNGLKANGGDVGRMIKTAAHGAMDEYAKEMTAALVNEMIRYLPVIEEAESNPEIWNKLTKGTGIATANGYRAAIKKHS